MDESKQEHKGMLEGRFRTKCQRLLDRHLFDFQTQLICDMSFSFQNPSCSNPSVDFFYYCFGTMQTKIGKLHVSNLNICFRDILTQLFYLNGLDIFFSYLFGRNRVEFLKTGFTEEFCLHSNT